MGLSGRNSGKTPETLSERFLEFPSRVRLGSPKPYSSRHLRLPEHFQNSLPPSTAGGASFFRSGSGEGLSELSMEFLAVLRAFLIFEIFRGPATILFLGVSKCLDGNDSALVIGFQSRSCLGASKLTTKFLTIKFANAPIYIVMEFLPRPFCRNVFWGFLSYKFWRIFAEIFLEDFSRHFFPQKWEKIRRENPRKDPAAQK